MANQNEKILISLLLIEENNNCCDCGSKGLFSCFDVLLRFMKIPFITTISLIFNMLLLVEYIIISTNISQKSVKQMM